MATSPYVIEYQGAFHLDLPPEQVWAIISRTDRYEGWWGWLREFETEGRDLETGSVLRGVVVPPLPYRMRLEVVLTKSTRPRRIDAVVSGDLRGQATLTLNPDGEGTEATVGWSHRDDAAPDAVRGAACLSAAPLGPRPGGPGDGGELPAAPGCRGGLTGRSGGFGFGRLGGRPGRFRGPSSFSSQ